MYYDPNKKRIITFGSSKPCGCNHNKSSIHAEVLALNYCLKNDRNNRYQIYISRYTKTGHFKSKTCCKSCTQLLKKYNYQDKVFTFENNKIIPAIIESPEVSLSYKIKSYRIKHGL